MGISLTKGRIERNKVFEDKIKLLLEEMPDYVSRWNNNMYISGIQESSRYVYLGKLKMFLRYISDDIKNVDVSEFNVANVEDYFTQIVMAVRNEECSNSNAQLTKITLNKFFSYLVKIKMIEDNPMSVIKLKNGKDKVERKFLSLDDFRDILLAVDQSDSNYIVKRRDRAILYLFMSTGMRAGALREISIEDVDMDEHTIRVIEKREKDRTFELNDKMMELLSDWLRVRHIYSERGHSSALFLSNRGDRLGKKTIQQIVDKYCQSALGKHMSPHKLRAGFATNLYNETHDLLFVKNQMGHAKQSTTELYVVQSDDSNKRASELMEKLIDF